MKHELRTVLCLTALAAALAAPAGAAAAGQPAETQKQQIYAVKRDAQYLYADVTAETGPLALQRAEGDLYDQASRYAARQGQKPADGAALKGRIGRITMPRGGMFRAFLYLRKTDALATAATAAPSAAPRPAATQQPTTHRDIAVARLLQLSRGSELRDCLTLKAKSGDVDFYEDNTRGLTLGLNYFPISINGAELALGYNFNHFMVEAAIAGGFNASDDLILDNTKVTRYGCNRFSLRLGYDLKIGRRFALQPQAALVRNYISADDVFFQLNEDLTKMENAEVYALGLGARLLWAPFGKTFRLHVTPHYSIRLAEKNWQPLADVDDTIKAYGEGFQLVAGLMLYF